MLIQMPRICEVVGSEKFNSFGARWDVRVFTKGSTAKTICRPRFCIYSLSICTGHIAFPVLAFVKIFVKYQTGICNQNLYGRLEVRNLNGYRLSSEEQRLIMNVSMRLIRIFWVKLFRTEKSQILSVFFLLKKPIALKNIQNLKMCKKSQCENSQIWKSSKKKNPSLLLEYATLDVVLYQVLRVSEQLWLQKVSVILWSYPNAITKPSVSVIINLRCRDSVCLCSIDFVSGSNIENWNNAVCSRNKFNGHCLWQVARSTCTSSLSLFRYMWVLTKHDTTVWVASGVAKEGQGAVRP